MTKFSWVRNNARRSAQHSLHIQYTLDQQLRHQALSARQMAAGIYRDAAADYQVWRAKAAAQPANRMLQAVLKLKYQRRKAAYEHWTEVRYAKKIR